VHLQWCAAPRPGRLASVPIPLGPSRAGPSAQVPMTGRKAVSAPWPSPPHTTRRARDGRTGPQRGRHAAREGAEGERAGVRRLGKRRRGYPAARIPAYLAQPADAGARMARRHTPPRGAPPWSDPWRVSQGLAPPGKRGDVSRRRPPPACPSPPSGPCACGGPRQAREEPLRHVPSAAAPPALFAPDAAQAWTHGGPDTRCRPRRRRARRSASGQATVEGRHGPARCATLATRCRSPPASGQV